MGDALAIEEQRSILSVTSIMPEPVKIVRRIRALVTKLLPVEVEIGDIADATSSIITPEVIEAFGKCGGDFSEAIPFALLRARATFMKDAVLNPPDYGESVCRATACEVLARRIIHTLDADRLESVMSTRFRYRESDGDASAPTSALESAIDQHCTIFLSSTEAQHVVNSLWRGDWIQRNNEDDDIDYVQYERTETWSFWDHVNPERMSVPRYQSTFKIIVWVIFLFVYSQAVSSPLDTLDPAHQLDEWEYVLYIMALSFLIEEGVKVAKTLRLANRPLATINFWTVVSFLTDAILLSAFGLRLAGLIMGQEDNEQARNLQFRSFQLLSCAAPLIWMKLLTVFDGVKAVGTLQVVVFRMLRESAIFFILLAILGVGFMQSMYALDAADGESGGGIQVFNSLVQALLGSPDFDTPNERFGYPFGLIIYYSWNFLATIILVNVLIALFGSAYSDVVENATDEYLAFFANKTIELIRAPDSFVYPAPFNLIEAILIAPFEFILSAKAYVKLNRFVMCTIFSIPLGLIALFETQIAHSRSERIRLYFDGSPPDEEGDPKVENPESDDPNGEICKVSFNDLVKAFPDTAITESAVVHKEMKALKAQIDRLERLISEGPKDKKESEGKKAGEKTEALKEVLVDDK